MDAVKRRLGKLSGRNERRGYGWPRCGGRAGDGARSAPLPSSRAAPCTQGRGRVPSGLWVPAFAGMTGAGGLLQGSLQLQPGDRCGLRDILRPPLPSSWARPRIQSRGGLRLRLWILAFARMMGRGLGRAAVEPSCGCGLSRVSLPIRTGDWLLEANCARPCRHPGLDPGSRAAGGYACGSGSGLSPG